MWLASDSAPPTTYVVDDPSALEYAIAIVTAVATLAAVGVAVWQSLLARAGQRDAEKRAEAAEDRAVELLQAEARERREAQGRMMRLRMTYESNPAAAVVRVRATVENRSDDIVTNLEVVMDDPMRVTTPADARLDRLDDGEEEVLTFEVSRDASAVPPPTRPTGSLLFADTAGRMWRRDSLGYLSAWPGAPGVKLRKSSPPQPGGSQSPPPERPAA